MSCLVSSLVTCATPMQWQRMIPWFSYELREFFKWFSTQNAVCCWPDRPIYSPKALKPQLRQLSYLAWHTQSCVTCPGHSRAMASSKKTVSSFPPGLTCLLRKTPHSHWCFAKPPISCRCKTWDVFSAQGLAGRRFCQSFSQLLLQLPWHYTWFDTCSLLVAGISLATCCHKNWISSHQAEAKNSKTSSTNRRCLNLSNLNTAVKPLQTKWCCGLAISNWTASCLQRYSYHTRRSKPEKV